MPPRLLRSVPHMLEWLARHGVRGLTLDSRRVVAGDAFIAWPGHAQDGRQYVPAALEAGALACLVEAEGANDFDFDDDDRIATVANLKALTGPLAAAFMGAPSARLEMVAVTGTNGKTSTAWWVAQALSALGQRSGVVGTLGVGEPPSAGQAGTIVPTGLTTPDPVALQATLKRFAGAGFAACAIEASSIGIVEHRLAGTHIDVAVFTNFTQDHLDFHGSMATYWEAKAQLFHWPGLKAAVINIDDPQGAKLAGQLAGGRLDVWTCSAAVTTGAIPGMSGGKGGADRGAHPRLSAADIAYIDGGLGFTLHEGESEAVVRSGLIGDYNVANVLGVIGALRALGVPLADAAGACAGLTPVPGRMQRVSMSGDAPEVVVDYAHTPDALEKTLRALEPLAQARGGALWCVFGCGGNRDTGKRPLMGALAQKLARHVVVTSDNPRYEEPRAILSQITAGMDMNAANQPWVIEDRREAISHVLSQAAACDVILLAGKGHEDYQDIAGTKHPFDDVAEARLALQRRAAR